MWTQLPKPYVPDVYQTSTENLCITLSTTMMPNVYTVTMTGNVFPNETMDVTAKNLDDAKEKALMMGIRVVKNHQKEMRRRVATGKQDDKA
ncbi:MAG: hypothetical protein HDQ88_05050 [Clostridia bacterium]|nr:hypothetical protein [Clostridia bacterium]